MIEASKNLYIYLLQQTSNRGWDTYDSCVVVAQDEMEARHIHPSGDRAWTGNRWGERDGWVSPDEVQVTLLGEAIPGAKCGVVCRSFNAG